MEPTKSMTGAAIAQDKAKQAGAYDLGHGDPWVKLSPAQEAAGTPASWTC